MENNNKHGKQAQITWSGYHTKYIILNLRMIRYLELIIKNSWYKYIVQIGLIGARLVETRRRSLESLKFMLEKDRLTRMQLTWISSFNGPVFLSTKFIRWLAQITVLPLLVSGFYWHSWVFVHGQTGGLASVRRVHSWRAFWFFRSWGVYSP